MTPALAIDPLAAIVVGAGGGIGRTILPALFLAGGSSPTPRTTGMAARAALDALTREDEDVEGLNPLPGTTADGRGWRWAPADLESDAVVDDTAGRSELEDREDEKERGGTVEVDAWSGGAWAVGRCGGSAEVEDESFDFGATTGMDGTMGATGGGGLTTRLTVVRLMGAVDVEVEAPKLGAAGAVAEILRYRFVTGVIGFMNLIEQSVLFHAREGVPYRAKRSGQNARYTSQTTLAPALTLGSLSLAAVLMIHSRSSTLLSICSFSTAPFHSPSSVFAATFPLPATGSSSPPTMTPTSLTAPSRYPFPFPPSPFHSRTTKRSTSDSPVL